MKMQQRERICRHCHKPYTARAGRGLCRPCWDDSAIRDLYPDLANFGGKEAQLFATIKAIDPGHEEQERGAK